MTVMELAITCGFVGSKVKVTCTEGYLGTDSNQVAGYCNAMEITKPKEDLLVEVLISKTQHEPVDGEYTWIDTDFIEKMEVIA